MDNGALDLATNGGRPTRTQPWPRWPQSSSKTAELLRQVLESEDWSLTGHSGLTEPMEMRFSRDFASFYGTNFCVPTSSGSTAIMTALLAAQLHTGDEVLIPGNAWVACAAAVHLVGGIPVFVDIDPETQCLSRDDLREKITSK